METTDLLFALLRHAVCDEELNTDTVCACTPENLEAVYVLAQKHDLAHLVAYALEGMELPECELLTKLKKAKMMAIYRYARQDHEFLRICEALEEARIPFIPLKGAVLRQYYPEPWMRTCCDIDILVKDSQLMDAVSVLTDKLDYQTEKRGDHDISLSSPNGIHLELHFIISEERFSNPFEKEILDHVWEKAFPQRKDGCFYELTDDMFYFYHISHMAKHMIFGGCGIRSFLDLWILIHRIPKNDVERDALLAKGRLLQFSEGVQKIAEVWFSDIAEDPLSMRIRIYVISGGTYGTSVNQIAWKQARYGGKSQFWKKRRIFVSYEYLCLLYPVLKKYKWLTPVYQIVRWIRLLRRGGVGKLYHESVVNKNVSDDTRENAEELLRQLGF